MDNTQSYRTQVGLFVAGYDQPCAVTMEVSVDSFNSLSLGPPRAAIQLLDKDGNKLAGVIIGAPELKRLALQILMGLF